VKTFLPRRSFRAEAWAPAAGPGRYGKKPVGETYAEDSFSDE